MAMVIRVVPMKAAMNVLRLASRPITPSANTVVTVWTAKLE